MKKFALALALALTLASAACDDDDNKVAATPAINDAGSSETTDAAEVKPDAGVSCEAAKTTTLGPIDAVSVGEVKTLEDKEGVRTIYVDGTAVSQTDAKTNPRIYVNLETAKRVEVTDVTAATSSDWDLAIKRPVFFTNSGQGGNGQGGAKFFANKDFAAVTKADAADLATEGFFDAECNPQTDEMGAIKTSFTGWYDYDLSDNTLKPFAGTWIVRGGTGKLFKLAILSYYANPDGTKGEVSARYTMKVAPLE